MKYCSHCGKEIMDAAVVCPHCGKTVKNADMRKVKSRRKVYVLVLAFLLLISGLYTLYHNISLVLTLQESSEKNPVWLMSEFIGIAAAIAAVCLAGIYLCGKGNTNARADRAIWIFYLIGSLVSNILYIISQQKEYPLSGLALGFEIREISIMRLFFPQIQSFCLLLGLIVLLLAITRKKSLANKWKVLWFVGIILLVLHIIASALPLTWWVYLNNLGTLTSEATRQFYLDFTFNFASNIILDAALFIKLSLETVWADVTLPVPEQADLPAQTNSPVMEVKEEGPKMKYCSHCGKEIMDAAVVCPHCGCPVNGGQTVDDTPSTGLNAVSFLLPLVGLILYLVYHDKAPQKAAAIGKWALIGLVAGIVLSGIYYGAVLSAFM